MIKFTKASVSEWFAAKGDDHVGIAGEPEDCPLANYFHAHGDQTVQIFHDTRRSYLNKPKGKAYQEVSLPIWARTFVELADAGEPDDEQHEFTGKEALAILVRAAMINKVPVADAKNVLSDALSTESTPVQPETEDEEELASACLSLA